MIDGKWNDMSKSGIMSEVGCSPAYSAGSLC